VFGKENVKILALLSSERTRLERCRTENECEELLRKDAGKVSWGLKELIANADYTLENEGSLKDFRANLAKIIWSFQGE
jgi:dephospho-CoA kinase